MPNLVLGALIYLLYYNIGPVYAQDESEDEKDERDELDKLEELDAVGALEDSKEIEKLDFIDKGNETEELDDREEKDKNPVYKEIKIHEFPIVEEYREEEVEEEPEKPGRKINIFE